MVIMANGNIEMSNNSNLSSLNANQVQLSPEDDDDNSIVVVDDQDDSSASTNTNNYYPFYNSNTTGNARRRSGSHNGGSTSVSSNYYGSGSCAASDNSAPSGNLGGNATTNTSGIIKVGLYDIGEVIGEGNFATVRFARHRHTKSDVAIKIIDKTKLSKPDLDKVHREIEIMRLLNHPNIVKLYQVMKTDKLLYLVTEYAPKGEIFDHIVTNGKLNESDARQKFWQIMSALDYCHRNRVVHRDLKAENLLLDANGNIKIADFGFGNRFSPDDKLSTFCGSPPYAAPELFEGKTYTGPEVDIWSLGVVLYVLVCGGLPFYGDNLRDLKDRVLKGVFRIPYWMSEGCEHLIRRMLVRDPDKRYSLEQIKKHRWVLADDAPKLIKSISSSCVSSEHGTADDPYNEQVLRMMDQLGLERHKTIEQLNKNNVYSHYTAIYQLLLDRTRMHRSSHPLDRPSFDYRQQRRPSTLADNALSQTVYLQQLHQASLARAAQMDNMAPSIPVVNVAPSLPQSCAVAHTVTAAVGGALPATPSMDTSYSTSTESGLEIDMDVGDSYYGDNMHPSCKPPLARRHTLTAMTGIMPATNWLRDISGPSTDSGSGMELPSQSHSVESNLGYSDVHNTQQMFDCLNDSNGGLEMFSTRPNLMADRHPRGFPHTSASEKVQLDARDVQRQKARSPINFREGRRASDGLMCQDVIAFRQKLKDGMKAGGMLELRQEHNQLVENHTTALDSSPSEQETAAVVKIPLGKRMSLPTNSIDLPPHKLLEMKKSIQLNQNLAVSQDFEATHSHNHLGLYEPVHLQPLPSGASLQRQVHNRTLMRRQGYKQPSAVHQQFQHMHIEQSHVLSTSITSTGRSNKHPPVTRQPSYKLAQQQPVMPPTLHALPVLRWPAQTSNFSLGAALANNGLAASTTAGVPCTGGGINPQSAGLYTSPTT